MSKGLTENNEEDPPRSPEEERLLETAEKIIPDNKELILFIYSLAKKEEFKAELLGELARIRKLQTEDLTCHAIYDPKQTPLLHLEENNIIFKDLLSKAMNGRSSIRLINIINVMEFILMGIPLRPEQ
ncbi:MAG: hypothetical protein WCW30_03075 [Candidatus Gracilibacteria bacterium]|jgi:hypothetical protein